MQKKVGKSKVDKFAQRHIDNPEAYSESCQTSEGYARDLKLDGKVKKLIYIRKLAYLLISIFFFFRNFFCRNGGIISKHWETSSP